MKNFSFWIVSSAKKLKTFNGYFVIDLQFCSYWFWCFSSNANFHFYISKQFTNLGLIFLQPGLNRSKAKNLIYIKTTTYIYIFVHLKNILFLLSFSLISRYFQALTMGKGIGCENRHIQPKFPNPSPESTFVVPPW